MFERFLRQRKAFCFGVYLPNRGKIGREIESTESKTQRETLREESWSEKGKEGGREGEKERRGGRSKEKF